MTTKEAFDALQKAIKEDEGYAFSWHCNIAMAAVDAGVNHKIANEAATIFMERCFGVKTKHPAY